jgi:hypothetical protein
MFNTTNSIRSQNKITEEIIAASNKLSTLKAQEDLLCAKLKFQDDEICKITAKNAEEQRLIDEKLREHTTLYLKLIENYEALIHNTLKLQGDESKIHELKDHASIVSSYIDTAHSKLHQKLCLNCHQLITKCRFCPSNTH